ncbi:serine/threonine-protein phosphatase [Streptacidiphilus sp. ASG 303]|uniref:PP2C family protein-serine/threonine phosphatase n=1 Tax=Streptacidiphilus sp. ASG 303 TaxID=2896847 RepID=UPI001E29FFE7|nr:PP2C family protein-serine/threonine phosphatase [Streptacidiphilus sp. ASG 303]MCD0483619.1 serine/threonine-protein phosphatase [Streptacidiphilus sp. ASG 303]
MDDRWAEDLHRLWQAADEAVDVMVLADDLYDVLLRLPGVRVVVGTRWDGASRGRYLRALTAGDAAPTLELLAHGPYDGTPRRPAASAEVREHAVAELRGSAWPEAGALGAAGVSQALTCTFRLGDGEWSALTLGTGDFPERKLLEARLRQVSEIVAACGRRIAERGLAERLRAADALLAEASLQMDASLDVEETVQRVARIAVPAVAVGCLVHLYRDRELQCVAAVHVAARSQRGTAELGRSDPWLARLIARAVRSPQGLRLNAGELGGGPFSAAGDAGEVGDVGDVGAVTVDALRARGRVLGTITFLYGRPEPRMPEALFLGDLAKRAALALDNAMLYEQRRQHVLSLQRHLLPAELPHVQGLDLGASYEVGDPMLDVGGDFYDVVPRDGGAALVIGDVCGRGAEAAALTGLARHTLRTLLEDGAPPGTALSRLNAALRRERTSRFVTGAIACLDPDGGEGMLLRTASAGHPPPLLLRADGAVEQVRAGGLLLGVVDEPRYTVAEDRLRPGDTAVFFTDGLTESRARDGSFFEGLLPGRLAGLRGLGAARVAEELAHQAVDFRASGADDIALLVARVRGADEGADRGAAEGTDGSGGGGEGCG